MAATKRLSKERISIERSPIPYITFQESESDQDETNILEWKILLELSPAHDSLDEPSVIGCAADSPYCIAPPSSDKDKSSKGGLLSNAMTISKNNSESKSTSSTSSESQRSQSAHFAFRFVFPPNYPFKPPAITVLSKSPYHPNIKSTTGEICDAMLTGEGWGPTLNVKKVCAQLRKFLCEPDPDHPLEGEVATLLVDQPEEYKRKCWGYARESCTREKALVAVKGGM